MRIIKIRSSSHIMRLDANDIHFYHQDVRSYNRIIIHLKTNNKDLYIYGDDQEHTNEILNFLDSIMDISENDTFCPDKKPKS
jgi:uncharacterized membrane protein